MLPGLAGGLLGCHLGGVRGRLAGPLKPTVPLDVQKIVLPCEIGDRDDRVVERCANVGLGVGDDLALAAPALPGRGCRRHLQTPRHASALPKLHHRLLAPSSHGDCTWSRASAASSD